MRRSANMYLLNLQRKQAVKKACTYGIIYLNQCIGGIKLIKLIVVEDEPLMNRFIVNSIDWSRMGIEMCGSFFNGKAALEYIKENNVDVVLCDIEMPIMDGLELIEHVAPAYPKIKFIFLSNFDDFHMVKSAFQFGAADYILKADFSEETFCKVFSELADKIKPVSQKTASEHAMREQALKEYFWGGIISKSNRESLKINMQDSLTVAVVKLVNYEIILKSQWNSEKENIKFGLSNCIEEMLEDYETGEFFFNEYDEIIFVFSTAKAEGICKDYGKLFCDVIDVLNRHFNLDAIAGIYDRNDECPAKEQYNVVRECLKYTLIFGKNRLISLLEISDFDDTFVVKENVAHARELIRKFEFKELCGFLENVASLKTAPCYIDGEREFYSIIISEMKEIFEGFMLESLKQKISTLNTSFSSAAEINAFIREATDKLMSQVVSSDIVVMRIQNYVYENYSEDITLKALAEKFSYDYGGLSRRFQKVTGMTFPNFLNEIRLNEAMKIIKITDHKISTVAQMVGYNNYESFSRNFKKKFNKLPNEIRKEDTP